VPLRRIFAITSILFLAVLAVSPLKNALRPYRGFQRAFARLGAARAKSLQAAKTYQQQPVAIHQIWLPDFENRVDRCTTCHLGVQDAAMAGVPEPFRVHPATYHTPKDSSRFGCTACHGGQGLATLEKDAHGAVADAESPMVPLKFIESGCGRCHSSEQVAGAATLSLGRATLERNGCYACHTVKGHEAFRSEAPPIEAVGLKTGAEALRRWLKDPKAVDPNATMPRFQLSPSEVEELSNYVFSLTPGRALADRVQAAAAEPTGDVAKGKALFAESRCISCHTLEGKGNGSAPELSKVASRASAGWLLAFIRDPHAFNPRTRMPQFNFSADEARHVVAYMESEFKDFDAPKEILDPLHVNQTLAEKGKVLFRQKGCFACHAPGTEVDRFGPALDGIGDKRAASLDFGKRTDIARTLPAWLEAKVKAPGSFQDGLKMPTFALSPKEAQAAVTALLSLGARPVPQPYRFTPTVRASLLPGGAVGALMDKYRCLSCHQIGDRGGDISTAPLTAEGSKVKRDWLVNYLVLSFTIRPILTDRMPVFRMTRDEATQLAQAFETFYLDPRIPEDPYAGQPATSRDPVEGKRLYDTLGCRACHILGAGGGYYGPPLTEAGTRLKPGWTYAWLKGPQKWRADVRCPNYGLTDADALRLTSYLDTLVKSSTASKAKRGGTR
jgi:mono/diheme cytochrome c family protein